MQMSDSEEEKQNQQVPMAQGEDEDEDHLDDQDGSSLSENENGNDEDDDDDDDDEELMDEGGMIPAHHVHIVDDMDEEGEHMDEEEIALMEQELHMDDDDNDEDDDVDAHLNLDQHGRIILERRLQDQVNQDIINFYNQDQEGLARPRLNDGRAPQGDWSELESQVQNILSNLRGLNDHIGRPVPPANQWALGGRPRDRYEEPNNLNLVEQMFDGVKSLNKIELLDIVMTQKASIDSELRIEEEYIKSLQKQSQFNLNAAPFIPSVDSIEDFDLRNALNHSLNLARYPGDPFMLNLQDQNFDLGGLRQIGNFNIPADPLFMRNPPFGEMPPFIPDPFNNPLNPDGGGVSYNRLAAQVVQDSIQDQLLQLMEVHYEDNNASESDLSVSDRLRSSVEGRSMRESLMEIDNERRRLQDISRANQDEIEIQRQAMNLQQEAFQMQQEAFRVSEQRQEPPRMPGDFLSGLSTFNFSAMIQQID
mmetsp:Transcript_9556/g.9164  ORF Transcript_9556/g.9164 Transcript_9556/m.9164 type:complete len:478 (-) Transcript_9556:4156-5589(-)